MNGRKLIIKILLDELKVTKQASAWNAVRPTLAVKEDVVNIICCLGFNEISFVEEDWVKQRKGSRWCFLHVFCLFVLSFLSFFVFQYNFITLNFTRGVQQDTDETSFKELKSGWEKPLNDSLISFWFKA